MHACHFYYLHAAGPPSPVTLTGRRQAGRSTVSQARRPGRDTVRRKGRSNVNAITAARQVYLITFTQTNKS